MLRNPYGIALMVYYVVMAVVGMLIPDDILRNYSGTKEFSDFMASIVPQIDRITTLKIKPDVNRFYFSVLWAGSPVLVLLVVAGALSQGLNTEAIQPNDSIKKMLGVGVALTAISLAILPMPFAENSPGLTNMLIGSFFGRSLFGQVLFVSSPIILLSVALINIPYFILTGQYGRAIEEKRRAATQKSSNLQ